MLRTHCPLLPKLLAGADGERAPESEIGVGTLAKRQKLNRAGGWRTQGQLGGMWTPATALRSPSACFTGGSGQGPGMRPRMEPLGSSPRLSPHPLGGFLVPLLARGDSVGG